MTLISQISSTTKVHIALRIFGLLAIYFLLWAFFIFSKGPTQIVLKNVLEPCQSKQKAIELERQCPHPLLQVIFHFW